MLCAALVLTIAIALLGAPVRTLGEPRREPLSWNRGEDGGPPPLFARALAKHGEWTRLAADQVAWRPAGVDDGWRPYAHGSWTWTEEGWFWVSDEPWAWATYHFGRWRHDPRLGWIWIPGHEWAPAWVVWRYGAGMVGWAPRTDGGVVLAAHWTFMPAERLAGADAIGAALHAARLPDLLVRSQPVEEPPITSRAAPR